MLSWLFRLFCCSLFSIFIFSVPSKVIIIVHVIQFMFLSTKCFGLFTELILSLTYLWLKWVWVAPKHINFIPANIWNLHYSYHFPWWNVPVIHTYPYKTQYTGVRWLTDITDCSFNKVMKQHLYEAKCNLGEVKIKPMLPLVLLISASNLWVGHP